MDAKEKLLNVIEERLTVYANWVNQGGGIRSDASEDLYCALLNTALGYDLENMNWVADNFPAIDLGDAENHLAVQVTSTGTADKVKKTLERFYAHKLNDNYKRLIVLIAGKAECRPTIFDHPGLELEIWGTAELIQELRRLPLKVLRNVEALLLERVDGPQMHRPRLHMPVPERRSPVGFLGRGKELAELRRRMDDREKPVILAGLGGVGKTMLAGHFAGKWPGEALFVRFDGSFTRTLADGVGRHIPPEQRRGLSEEAVAELALGLLGQYGAGDLLIVDNAEVPGVSWRELTKDPCYARLRELPMKLLMTTRNRDTGGLWLGNLERGELREIFRRHEVDIPMPDIDRLINAVGGHTMTVDMIARTIRESWGDVTAETILTAMETSTLHAGDFDDIENDHDPEQGKIYAHLRALFSLSGISEDGRQALRCATLLPQDGMDAALFRNALPEGAAQEIKKLEKKGWVDRKEGLVTIHPVVRLVCRTELVPTEENCKEFLLTIRGQYDQKQYNAVKFRQMAELFGNAAKILEDETGFWAVEAGYFWNQVGEQENALELELQAEEKLKKYRPETADHAATYNNLGGTYGNRGDHKQALVYLLKALRIREQVLPSNHSDLAQSYNNVGGTYGALGDHEKELVYLLKALGIWEQILPSDHPNLALCYNNVGGAYGNLGDHESELEFYLKAMRIRERVLSEDHPELATSYNNVGEAYGDLGDQKRKFKYIMKALRIRERVLPKEHPDLAQSYNNVGGIYYAKGGYTMALEYQQKAWAILEKALPTNHPYSAACCNNIAWTYYALEQLALAAKYMRRAADIINCSSLPEHHRDRVNYNKWADQMEEIAQQARGGACPSGAGAT